MTQLSEPEPPKNYLVIEGLCAQSLTGLMKKTFSNNDVKTFNYNTYEYRWRPPGSSGPAQTLMGEMYTSPAMIRLHREIQNLDIDCDLPRCCAAYMFMSDGMQFAQFSHVKGWPILCSFGNASKYERCKPTSNTCYPIAHIPTLPDKVRKQIAAMHGKPPSEDLMTHLRRELMHAVWLSLLDDEFIDAWKNGVVIDCADGVRRRVFPRILTYSADYPEKVLLATIRNNGKCLCPRCFVLKTATSQMGTPTDMRTRKKRRIDDSKRRGKIEKARRLIYAEGKMVQSKAVESLLKDQSYVPTMNAFSDRLRDFKFNFFATLVVDELHEVELAVTEFNQRFRAIPTFSSTIRMFAEDVADMGRIAARDFEDILQCCMPAFKGLLPEICDGPAQSLLFLFAEWHGLAKLRLHMTESLKIFKSITTRLGTALRNFVKLTEELQIRETPKEYTRRKKQAEASKSKSLLRRTPAAANRVHANKNKASSQKKADGSGDGNGDGRQIVTLNLNTYKFHSIGDYPWNIEEYGTLDSYSTQIGELQNRKYKAQYMRTNKRDAIEQMTEINDIMTSLQEIDKELKESLKRPDPRTNAAAIDSLTEGRSYYIGQKDRSEDLIPNVQTWLSSQAQDSAVKLKRHLLACIRGVPNGTTFSKPELDQVKLQYGQMYHHNTLRVNYTSYDILRQQDMLNAGTPHCFVMLPVETSNESKAHPFVYAKVLGVYHARVIHEDRLPQRMDFVHVRWLYYDYEQPGGWDHKRLDWLAYVTCSTNDDILDSFDFIDPASILRATHLIPDFCSKTTKTFLNLKKSIAYDSNKFGDWSAYYVNCPLCTRFVDRDMLMRYIGGGVGHYRQTANNIRAIIPNAEEHEHEDAHKNGEDEDAEERVEGEEDAAEEEEDAEEEYMEDEDAKDGDAEEGDAEDEDAEDEDAEDEEDGAESDVEGNDDDDLYDYDELCGF
ncbi:hypothetical protein FRC07_005073 [Ceratobasidium sp. 392]|nr:hypothetical protein FRC07_005073 [Ceratobasidium sp. 392]